jgi:putative ABC transport system permease protein
MLKAAIKGVFAHKVRLAMTALAIILGVAFISGTYVFTDTIQARFDTLLDDALAGVDVVVQPVEADFGNETLTLDAGVVDVVAAVPGVAVAQGSIEGYAQPISKDGEAIGGQGPPNLGFNWTADDGLNPLSIAEGNGRAPQGPGEVVIDAAVAKDFDFAVGDSITIQFETIPPEEFAVVGIANFGEEDNLAGATLAVFETSEAQRVMDLEGVFTSIEIRAEAGVEPEALASAIQETLPSDALAQTGAEETDDQLAEVAEGLGFLNTALLTFAGIAIFVGAFIIQNTFRIIVAQRTRELALMRAIGATGSQVVWMVLIEALIVAVVASAIGVGLGVLLAIGLRAGFEALGFIGIPEGALTIAPRTIIVGMTVGVVVTVLSAILPARRASIVPPVAAMRDVDLSAKGKTLRNRAIIGTIVGGFGLALLVFGLFGGPDNAIAFVGAGALFMFLGVATLAPLAAKPVAGVIGWPLPRLFGVSGNLAQENTQRQPRRTASTASALMIGVALVAFVSIFASSTKASVEENILGSFPADLSASSTNFETGVPPAFVADLKALPALTSVTAIQTGPVRIDGVQTAVIAADPSTINDVFSIDAAPGALEALDASSILLRTGELEDRGLAVGDTIDVEFALTGVQPLRIAGTYEDDGFGSWFISDEAYEANFGSSFAFLVFANAAEGIDDTTARAAMDTLAETYPTMQIQNKSEVVGAAEDQIDQILALFWLLLGLAVLIAVFGITNTLALSVHERTREIGLLRAVGMSRTGIRRMIRWEAVIIALFGALLGLGLGVVFGWSVIQALSDDGLGTFNLPYLQMMLYLGLAAIAGVVAAIFPARNAAKLNVLEAIAYE